MLIRPPYPPEIPWLLPEGEKWRRSRRPEDEGLLSAADRGDAAGVQRFLDAGADPNCADWKGMTPLHFAAWQGAPEVVRILLRAGSNPDARDREGWAAIHNVGGEQQGEQEIYDLLLSHGADINARTPQERTVLHYAAVNHLLLTERLITTGAELNVKDNNGSTPLHWAAYGGNPDLVDLFLRSGADPHVRDNSGRTPRDWAAAGLRGKAIRDLLTLFGA